MRIGNTYPKISPCNLKCALFTCVIVRTIPNFIKTFEETRSTGDRVRLVNHGGYTHPTILLLLVKV